MTSQVLVKGFPRLLQKSFFCPPQKYVKTQGTFYTTIFQNKFTLHHIKINIYRKLNSLLTNIYLILCSLEMQTRLIQIKVCSKAVA